MEDVQHSQSTLPFNISLGAGSRPECDKVTATTLTCQLNSALPPANRGAPTYGGNNEEVPLVKV